MITKEDTGMKQRLIRSITLAFMAIALGLSSPLTGEHSRATAQGTGELHHPASQRGQIVRRKIARKGAIGAGGAGVYKAKAKNRKTVRKVRPIKKRSVWDDTDIVH
jgi:hypothetical protein